MVIDPGTVGNLYLNTKAQENKDYNNRPKYATILCMSQTVGLRFLLESVIIISYFKSLRFYMSSGVCCVYCMVLLSDHYR